MNRGTGDIDFGVTATFDQAWKGAVTYTHYFGESKFPPVGSGGPMVACVLLHAESARTVHAGVVTSGTQTPFLAKAIGLAYLSITHASRNTSRTSPVARSPRRRAARPAIARRRHPG